MRTTRKGLMPFGAGAYVVETTDPRHAGRVEAVWGLPGVFTAKVRWLRTGWLSELPTEALREIAREVAIEMA